MWLRLSVPLKITLVMSGPTDGGIGVLKVLKFFSSVCVCVCVCVYI